MGHQIGRNDACPCGSGNKYKKCCMKTEASSSSNVVEVDFKWRQLRKLEGAIIDNHLVPYALQELPEDVIKRALADCFPEDLPEEIDERILLDHFFQPWLLFNWVPSHDFGLKRFDGEKTIASNYLKTHGARLSNQETLFIEAMGQSYYSFYSILQVEMEKSLLVRDILLGTTHTLKERQGTYQLERGDIVFTRILTLEGQSISIGMAPFIIPATYQVDLIDFRKWLIKENKNKVLTPKNLRGTFGEAVLSYFFDTLKFLFSNPLLMNTDDELLQFSKSYFKLTIDPQEAFNFLLPLTLEDEAEEFLQGAKKDKSGKIMRMKFPWLEEGNKKHKSWGHTVLGHIILEVGRLILETNSQERAQRGGELLSRYLGEAISFQQTLIETFEQKMKSLQIANANKNESTQNLLEPEIQEHFKVMAKEHWENWLDESIPVLENKTPRQAARTKEGKEKLEALLLVYERRDLEVGDNLFKADIDYLRRELGLNP